MLFAMRLLPLLVSLALSSTVALAQAPTAAPAFEVASLRPVQSPVGPDYNNRLTYTPAGITGRNMTLKRLLAEAYHLQLNQVSGPGWLDRDEFDLDARVAGTGTREQMALMLRTLIAERFKLTQHTEMREMRVYELTAGKSGPKIHPFHEGETVGAGAGFHFHGDLRQFADLLAVQFSIPTADNPSEPVRAGGAQIPVLDKTGLAGVFDFVVDLRPEPGTDAFTSWKRALEDRLGMKIESRQESIAVLVVDEAARTPTEN
jgi:uncharacterized protein (TIGR03435 family)